MYGQLNFTKGAKNIYITFTGALFTNHIITYMMIYLYYSHSKLRKSNNKFSMQQQKIKSKKGNF